MCVQNCRSFLWGGTGNPTRHFSPDAVACSCTCDSNSWADHNILGESSCVPRMVHAVFGWVGLTVAVVGLLHAIHQLRRQLKFHAQQLAVSVAPVERCRMHMHITAIVHAVLSLLYFPMVILLDDDRLYLSTVVLTTLQITVMVCGFLTVRMWIYTNDRRMIRGSPKLVKLSAFLESASGQRVCYLALAAGPVIGTAFVLAGRRETAVKIVGATFILLIFFADVIFWVFGTSLLRAIETSQASSRKGSVDATAVTASVTTSVRALIGTGGGSARFGKLPDAAPPAPQSGKKGSVGGREKGEPAEGAGDDAADRGARNLDAAKRKVKWAMIVCAQFSLQGYALLFCSVFTKYGTAAPCVLFGIQMTIIPLIWHVGNTQLHAGRSKLASLRGVGRFAGRFIGGFFGSTTAAARLRRNPSASNSRRLLPAFGAAAFRGAVAPVERDGDAATGAEGAGADGVDNNAITPC